MSRHLTHGLFNLAVVATLATVLLSPRLNGAISKDALEVPAPAKVPEHMPDDAAAVWLAMRCVEGPETGRPALIAALDRMGWGVKDREGNLLREPAIAQPTGLAMRDYEIESLFWNADLAPSLRFISYARGLAVTMPNADPEDIVQSLVNSIRTGAESKDPRRRFWARFIIALGMAQDGTDLTGPGEPPVLPADMETLKAAMPKIPEDVAEIPKDASDAEKMQRGFAIAAQMMNQGTFDIEAASEAATLKSLYPPDDPVLGKTPLPPGGSKSAEDRLNDLQGEISDLLVKTTSTDAATAATAQKRYSQLAAQMTNASEAIQASAHRRMLIENDPNYDEDAPDEDGASRFMAEHRATPLSGLQIALLTRVVVAEMLGQPPKGENADGRDAATRIVTASLLPLLRWQFAQAQPGGPPSSFSGQVASAGADMWATVSGTYTSLILDLHLPENPFSERVGQANAIIGWFKTLVMLFQNKITIKVENEPLIRTKDRQAGQKRRVKCVVEVEFPKTPDAAKALRGILNIASIDLQLPDGGPQSGAKVTWRITEGGAGNRIRAAGGSVYRTDLALVRFAGMAPGSAGNSAYVSYTNDAGEAFITIEGEPQKKNLPNNVRKKQRRAAISVEVNMKVGNLMQDLNDAVGAAGVKGTPGLLGVATMISEMIQRSSLFFQKGQVFQVIDWALPAWEGDIVITVKGSGSENAKGEKGGPDVRYEWSMDRAMEAHVQTPEWNQDQALERGIDTSNRITLEVTEATKRYRVTDFSSQVSTEVEAAFSAEGPIEIPPKSGGGPSWPSRASASGYAILTTWPETDPPKYSFNAEPTFTAKANVFQYERSRGRTKTENRVEDYSLLFGVEPHDLWENGNYDPETGMITGHKVVAAKGYLPFVPEFDVTLEFAYTLKYQSPPSAGAP